MHSHALAFLMLPACGITPMGGWALHESTLIGFGDGCVPFPAAAFVSLFLRPFSGGGGEEVMFPFPFPWEVLGGGGGDEEELDEEEEDDP